MNTWIVFTDRYNTTWVEGRNLSKPQARKLALKLSIQNDWPYFAVENEEQIYLHYEEFDGEVTR